MVKKTVRLLSRRQIIRAVERQKYLKSKREAQNG